MEYQVISADSIFGEYGLTKKVNELCKKGWRPQGGVSVLSKGCSDYFYQAMVKDDEDHFPENVKVMQV